MIERDVYFAKETRYDDLFGFLFKNFERCYSTFYGVKC